MSVFTLIATLCAIKGAPGWADVIERKQIACHAYYASCIGSPFGEVEARIFKCMKDRKP